jgi:hypothetical protein
VAAVAGGREELPPQRDIGRSLSGVTLRTVSRSCASSPTPSLTSAAGSKACGLDDDDDMDEPDAWRDSEALDYWDA